jgi:hypothetical protein
MLYRESLFVLILASLTSVLACRSPVQKQETKQETMIAPEEITSPDFGVKGRLEAVPR